MANEKKKVKKRVIWYCLGTREAFLLDLGSYPTDWGKERKIKRKGEKSEATFCWKYAWASGGKPPDPPHNICSIDIYND